jgi:hypothetical protein
VVAMGMDKQDRIKMDKYMDWLDLQLWLYFFFILSFYFNLYAHLNSL